MKYAVIATVVAIWTVLAFLYRAAGRGKAPGTWVAASSGVTWLIMTLVLAAAKSADLASVPHGVYLAGIIGGVGLTISMPLFMAAVSRGNLPTSWTILTLGFAAASLAALVYPGEPIEAGGISGLVAAGAAIAFLGKDSAAAGAKAGFKPGWGLYMSLAFVANALGMYVYTLAGAWGGLDSLSARSAFFIAQTAVFAAGSMLLCLLRPVSENRGKGMIMGARIGVVFFLGNYLAAIALGDYAVASYVFFPSAAGGSTISVALVSAVFLGERPGRWGWIGLVLGVVALILLGGSA